VGTLLVVNQATYLLLFCTVQSKDQIPLTEPHEDRLHVLLNCFVLSRYFRLNLDFEAILGLDLSLGLESCGLDHVSLSLASLCETRPVKSSPI